MPLPPLGVDRYREWAASRWRDLTNQRIGGVRSGLWDMQAEDRINRLRALELPEPEPLYQPPEPVYEPPPPPPPPPPPLPAPPPQSPLDALRAGVGATFSGIGGRASSALSGARGALTGGLEQAQQTAGGWAEQADAAIDGLGDTFGGMGQQLAGGFTQAQAAPLPSLDAPSPFQPSTPLEQAGALASRVPRAAAQPFLELPETVASLPYRFGEGVGALRTRSREEAGRTQASLADFATGMNQAAGMEVLTPEQAGWWSDTGAAIGGGLRRGQRGAVPRLTPEQQALRAADGEAEQTLFDAIRQLWRRGPEGEAAADDLRFLAVGKGQQGLASARAYLSGKGLDDVLGGRAAPGVLPPVQAARQAAGALGHGLDWLRERSREQEAATAAGDVGFSEAMNRAAARGGYEEVITPEETRFFREVGENVGGGLRRPTAGEFTDVLASAPLTSPPSQLANFLSGGVRSLERIGLELAEGRPIDALLDAFTTGRTVLSPSTWKKAGQAFGSGPTPRNPGATGTPGPDSLANAPGRLAQVLTAGTRANASLDEVVRSANEAGARAVAARRGLSGQALDDFVRQAGDYATITGPNSPVAHALNKAKAWVSEPGSSPAQKTVGYVAQALSGYVSMPERILVAALSSTASPLTGALGLGKAALTRDPTLARKAAGRLIYGSVLDYKLAQAAAGDTPGFHVYGPPPRDQALRREMEREGARWDSFVLGDPTSPDAKVIPTRYAGVFGQQASLIGSLHTAAVLADRKGDTGPIKALRLGNQLLKWTLDESYLSDYADFGAKVQDLGGIQYAVGTAAGIPARLGNIVSGPINASDPYERDTRSYEGFGGIVARTLPGGRYLLPEKIEPTTGEPMRRRGSGWDRYWGPQGTEQTPEAVELTRLDLTPHEFRSGEYAGVEQEPEALKRVKKAVGSETGKAVRTTMATPAYKEADDAGKAALLKQALKDADFEAELRLGEAVKRAPHQQAAYEYAAVPQFEGIKQDAPADEVRRYNHSVRQAKAARTEARKKYPNAPDRGEAEWARANRQQAILAQRSAADAEALKKRRDEIEARLGVTR